MGEQLGVSQPYVAKMVHQLKRDWLGRADKWRDEPEATLSDLRRLAETRKIAFGPRPVAVLRCEQIPSHPQHSPAWASYSTANPTQIDAAILAYKSSDSSCAASARKGRSCASELRHSLGQAAQ